MLLTIVSFILVLTVLVLVHELGHYLTAKWLGVKVEEFGFGFPPRAIGKKIGETIYSLNWLPIGGFVKLFGEDDAGGGKLSVPSSKKQTPSTTSGKNDITRAFFARPVWQRFVIVFAGVFMNFMLATILLTYLVGVQGIPTPGKDVYIVKVLKNTPAEKAGLKTGDRILSVDTMPIKSPEMIISYSKNHLGQQITLSVETKAHKTQTITIVPRVKYPSDEGAMGIAVGVNVVVTHYPWYMWPYIGLKTALEQSWLILVGLGQLLSQLLTKGQVPQGLAGPVGIAQVTGQFVQMGLGATLSLLALLSLNLAILNILPIPALDGGRMFFILIEAITGKKLPAQKEALVNTIGMAFLLLLFVFITFHDIVRWVTGGSLLPR